MAQGERVAGRILIVEDEGIVAADLADTLIGLGYDVVATTETAAGAIAKAEELAPDLILMDIRLAGPSDGIAAAAAIQRERNVPIVFLTAHSDDDTLSRALGTQPFGYIVKPFKAPELRCAIELALHKHEIEERLRERERWLATTIRSIGDAVVATDPDHRVTFLNPVAQALTGWPEASAVGKTLEEILQLVSEQSGSSVENPLRRAMVSKGVETLQRGATLVARSGVVTPVEDSAAPILDEQGSVLGGVMVFRDVTQQRRVEDEMRTMNASLEKRVLERTLQLEAANKELEAFSFSVAHDLRAPLRGIEGFSQVLIEDHAANLGEEGVEHLRRIRLSIRRMGQLIDDLLRLSRIARTELVAGLVDLSELATQVLSELAPRREVQIVVEPGIVARGDLSLLRIALTNLLSNALKFSDRSTPPQISVGRVDHEGAPAYFVRDNGAGFDMRYASRLFGAFQRLHHAADFEGTGIGLAIVQRIVHRHGGMVWADSAPGCGATFTFTLAG